MGKSLNKHQNQFLGGIDAIVVTNQDQFERLMEFMSVKNLFTSDGSPVRLLKMNISNPVAFYRDYQQSYIGYGLPQDVEKHYNLVDFAEAFADQMNFFGNGDIPLIHQPSEELIVKEEKKEEKVSMEEKVIEAETIEVSNELSLVEIINTLEVVSVVPATITENITVNKDRLIQAVKQYDNIVVTEDNFKELTKTRANLNDKKKYLIEQRKKVKNEASKNIDEFISSIKDVITAIEGVVDPLDAKIKNYENLEREKKKDEMMNNIIRPNLEKGIEAGYFTKEIAEQFNFSEDWLKANAFTKTGNLTAKTKEGINNELNRLITLYKQQQNDIATIESTVKQLSIARNLDNELGAETYIELYQKGVSMPEIQERMNHDIEMIKKTVDKAVSKNEQKVSSQQPNVQDELSAQQDENVDNRQDKSYVVDEKTGEALGRFNGKQILVDMATAPKGYESKNYSYTYSFSGPCAVIMTLNKFLKLLSKLFPEFKYERLGN